MTDAPKSPEPTEPEPGADAGADAGAAPAGASSPAEPEASLREAQDGAVERVEPVEPEAGPSQPKVARMDVDPDALDVGEHLETDLTSDAVTVRRAPRYPAFIGLGVVIGAIVALVLTFAYPESGEYDRGQVFGFLLLWCGAGGAALGGVAALVIDRVLAKRGGTAVAEHESTHYVDDEPGS